MREKSKAALLLEPCECGAGVWITAHKSPFLSELAPAKFPALSHHLPDGLQHLGLILYSPPWGRPHPCPHAQGAHPSRGRNKEGESNTWTPKPPPALPPGRRMKNSNTTTLQTPGPSRAPSTCGCRVTPGRLVAASPRRARVCVPTAPLAAGQRPAPRHPSAPRAESEPETFSRQNRVKNVLFFFFSIRSKPLCRGFGRKQM